MIIRTNKDKYEIIHGMDVSDVIESNKELKKQNGWSKDKEMRHIARIPIYEYYEMIRTYPEIVQGDNEMHQRALRKALNSDRYSIWKLRDE